LKKTVVEGNFPNKKHKVRLYVKGVKTATGTEEWSRWGWVSSPGVRGGYHIIPDYKTYHKVKYENVLPDDQKRVVEMVEEIAPKYGFDVEIIDVALEDSIHRVLEEKVKRIKTFPTLITDSGGKIEGNISKEQVESLLSKAKKDPFNIFIRAPHIL
jgi:hypothetical protein